MGLRQNAASKKGYNMGMHSLQLLSVDVGIYRMQWDCLKVSGMCVDVIGG